MLLTYAGPGQVEFLSSTRVNTARMIRRNLLLTANIRDPAGTLTDTAAIPSSRIRPDDPRENEAMKKTADGD
jgi:hypothetical protein